MQRGMETALLQRYGPWAVVTGASEGIGRAFAVQLAELGFHLVLVARRKPLLDEVARDLRARHAIEISVLALDLARSSSIDALVSAAAPLDIGLLVAAAGFGTSGDFLDNPVEEELAMVDVNCRAVAGLSHEFGRRFAGRGRGGIVLMSSLLAFQGVPRAANYAATKAYIQSLAEGLHAELERRGVDVIASAPGPIESGFGRRARMSMGMVETPEVVARGTLRSLGRRSTVRPGRLSKLLEASLIFLPRRWRVLILGRVMGGMTRKSSAMRQG